jgi:hypothetical protein
VKATDAAAQTHEFGVLVGVQFGLVVLSMLASKCTVAKHEKARTVLAAGAGRYSAAEEGRYSAAEEGQMLDSSQFQSTPQQPATKC